MSKARRTIEEDGVNLGVRMLPEIRAMVYAEADVRARGYGGAVGGEKRSRGSYLATVALLHFLRLSPEERKGIYAEMRAVMDERCRVSEDAPLRLAPADTAPADTLSGVPANNNPPLASPGRKRGSTPA